MDHDAFTEACRNVIDDEWRKMGPLGDLVLYPHEGIVRGASLKGHYEHRSQIAPMLHDFVAETGVEHFGLITLAKGRHGREGNVTQNLLMLYTQSQTGEQSMKIRPKPKKGFMRNKKIEWITVPGPVEANLTSNPWAPIEVTTKHELTSGMRSLLKQVENMGHGNLQAGWVGIRSRKGWHHIQTWNPEQEVVRGVWYDHQQQGSDDHQAFLVINMGELAFGIHHREGKPTTLVVPADADKGMAAELLRQKELLMSPFPLKQG